jgi:hypothetical protein
VISRNSITEDEERVCVFDQGDMRGLAWEGKIWENR